MGGLIQPVSFKTFKRIVETEKRKGGHVHYADFGSYVILSLDAGANSFAYECIAEKDKVSAIELRMLMDSGIPTIGRILNIPDRVGETLNEIKRVLEESNNPLLQSITEVQNVI